jgi:hypothetical protein
MAGCSPSVQGSLIVYWVNTNNRKNWPDYIKQTSGFLLSRHSIPDAKLPGWVEGRRLPRITGGYGLKVFFRPKLCENSLFPKIAKIITTWKQATIYITAEYGTTRLY